MGRRSLDGKKGKGREGRGSSVAANSGAHRQFHVYVATLTRHVSKVPVSWLSVYGIGTVGFNVPLDTLGI